jgi:hypothetical protein
LLPFADYANESVIPVIQPAEPSSPVLASDPNAVDSSVAAPAQWLRISVTRAGRVVVQVCFPSYAVLSLSDLVPDDVRTRIVGDKVDLDKVAADAAARGCVPGELFVVSAGEHAVRAWLD